MNRSETVTRRSLRAVGSILLALLLFAAFAAPAQVITVTSADPPETEQGTLGLVVKIAGANFGKDSKVSFLVTGTTNPGGVTVKSVKYRNPKSLEAIIDVAPDAQTQNRFDIQVQSGGRTGKGTELFSVKVKTTGGDTTPPGDVTDLSVSEVGFNTAVLTWTAPANDGHDESSGAATKYDLRVRKATQDPGACGPYDEIVWGTNGWKGIQNDDPCQSYAASPAAGVPGTTETKAVFHLAPDTDYWAALKTVDAATPEANWSGLSDQPLVRFPFRTAPFPPTSWSTEIVDECPVLSWSCSVRQPRFAYDGYSAPALLYPKENKVWLASRTGAGWIVERVGAPVDIGNYEFDIAFDPDTNEATIANVVRVIGPVNGTKNELRLFRRTGATSEPWASETIVVGDVRLNGPALVYNPVTRRPSISFQQNLKAGRSAVLYAERNLASWKVEQVATGAGAPVHLAFDPSGNPAMSFVKDVNGLPALGFARRVGGSWIEEIADGPLGSPWELIWDTAVAFDPSPGGGFVVASLFRDTVSSVSPTAQQVRFCDKRSGSWECEVLALGNFYGVGISLAFGPNGTAYLAYPEMPTLRIAVRPVGGAWTLEYGDWNAHQARLDIRVAPNGEVGVAYQSPNGVTGAGGSDGNYAVSFARRLE